MSRFTFVSLGVATALVLSFVGCGGGGGGSSHSNDNGGSDAVGNGGNGVEPIAAYSCEATQNYNGKTITMKLGANGSVTCDKAYGYPQLKFIDGVNEMVVKQLISHVTFNSKGNGNGTMDINLKEGTETIKGSDPQHGSVNCVNTYDVPTPLNIYDANKLLISSLHAYQRIGTTCPDWVNAKDDANEDVRDFTLNLDITATETSGKVSKISSYTKVE